MSVSFWRSTATWNNLILPAVRVHKLIYFSTFKMKSLNLKWGEESYKGIAEFTVRKAAAIFMCSKLNVGVKGPMSLTLYSCWLADF